MDEKDWTRQGAGKLDRNVYAQIREGTVTFKTVECHPQLHPIQIETYITFYFVVKKRKTIKLKQLKSKRLHHSIHTLGSLKIF